MIACLEEPPDDGCGLNIFPFLNLLDDCQLNRLLMSFGDRVVYESMLSIFLWTPHGAQRIEKFFDFKRGCQTIEYLRLCPGRQ
ncbi:hypothetical protein D3C76_983170 [compost metagenome]